MTRSRPDLAALLLAMVLGLLAGTAPLLLFGPVGVLVAATAVWLGALPCLIFATPTLYALAGLGLLNAFSTGIAGYFVNGLVWNAALLITAMRDGPDLFPQAELCLRFGSGFAPVWCGLAGLFYMIFTATRKDTS